MGGPSIGVPRLRHQTMNASPAISITPVRVADLLAEGERMPVYVHLIDHPDARVLVDTGMTELRPEVADMDPRLVPLGEQALDLAGIDVVVNTHLHFDHCGGNRRFAGLPIYVQRAELAAVAEPDYLVEWVRFEGADYRELDGDTDLSDGTGLFDGISVFFTPGHSPGHQCVVVETEEGPVVLGGDVTYSMGELIAGGQPNFDRIHALEPRLVYLAHSHRPWVPG